MAVGAQMPVFAPRSFSHSEYLHTRMAARKFTERDRRSRTGLAGLGPSDLFDPSFQLTFLSVISIVTLAVPIIMRMQAVGAWRPAHEKRPTRHCARRGFAHCLKCCSGASERGQPNDVL